MSSTASAERVSAGSLQQFNGSATGLTAAKEAKWRCKAHTNREGKKGAGRRKGREGQPSPSGVIAAEDLSGSALFRDYNVCILS